MDNELLLLIKNSVMNFCINQEFFCLGCSYSYFVFELLDILFMLIRARILCFRKAFDNQHLKSEYQLPLLSPNILLYLSPFYFFNTSFTYSLPHLLLHSTSTEKLTSSNKNIKNSSLSRELNHSPIYYSFAFPSK
jgi:hypothetical protein